MARYQLDPSRYPPGPGCYLMRDACGAVLYVGKARNVRRRLVSHFRGRSPNARHARLIRSVADVEVILVNNETEALVLEHNLIKQHAPPANRALTDEDEGYFYVALTEEALPRLVPYRKNRVNKELGRGGSEVGVARLFGPYVGRRFRDTLLKFVCDHFRLRTCAPLPGAVCLRYHLGVCGGVCAGHLAAAGYTRAVDEATRFLARPHTELLRRMRRQMAAYAAALHFERAAYVKQHVEALEQAMEPQVVERAVHHDQDVLHFGDAHVLVMHLRRGAVVGFDLHPAPSPDDFLLSHYGANSPSELIVSRVADRQAVQQALTATDHRTVRITAPPADRAAEELLKLCALNYEYRTA